MLLCCPPFIKPIRNKCQLFDLVADGKFNYFWSVFEEGNSILSHEVKHLLESIFQVEPYCRYTVSDVLMHEWMQMGRLTSLELKSKMSDITSVSVQNKKRSRSSK
jgi:serine/threonine protein kinase